VENPKSQAPNPKQIQISKLKIQNLYASVIQILVFDII